MKKTLATALALLILQSVLNRRLLFQKNKPAASSTRLITHHFFVFKDWAEENCRCNHCGGAENVVKTETQQTFVNGLLGFITLGIYTPLEARVYCSQ